MFKPITRISVSAPAFSQIYTNTSQIRRHISTAQRNMTTITTTVLYPDTEGKAFNLDYYLNKHMPLAEKLWGPLGMKDWEVTTFDESKDASRRPYRIKAVSAWASKEHLKNALESQDEQRVLRDAKNFTDEVPVLLVGETKGSVKCA